MSTIAILGAGAVGKWLGAVLARAGHNVTMWVRRPEQLQALREQGIGLYRQDGEVERHPVNAMLVQDRNAILNNQANLVLVTVKSYSTIESAQILGGLFHLDQSSPLVLSVQNGLGNVETLLETVPAEKLWAGVTTYGLTGLSDTEVALRGEGELVMGPVCNQKEYELVQLFRQTDLAIRESAMIQNEIWKKALINIGINAITAIHQVTNGVVAEREDLREQATRAIREAFHVADWLGVWGNMERPSEQMIVDRMLQVCRQTTANTSSMLQDVLAGRITEIESLNGWIVRHGRYQGLEVPINEFLSDEVGRIHRI